MAPGPDRPGDRAWSLCNLEQFADPLSECHPLSNGKTAIQTHKTGPRKRPCNEAHQAATLVTVTWGRGQPSVTLSYLCGVSRASRPVPPGLRGWAQTAEGLLCPSFTPGNLEVREVLSWGHQPCPFWKHQVLWAWTLWESPETSEEITWVHL